MKMVDGGGRKVVLLLEKAKFKDKPTHTHPHISIHSGKHKSNIREVFLFVSAVCPG